jgi:hypothetical protein
MTKLGAIDLEILFLGIKKDNSFDEKDIENSELKRLGVGRLLDSLASLKDRKLINMNKDGSFFVTEIARHVLWSQEVPLWVKILRLLEIKSCSIIEIANFLRKTEEGLMDEIENLRKNQLILMSPLRQESKIIKMYEIIPEGIDKINRVEMEGFQNNTFEVKDTPKIEILEIIEDVIKEVNKEPVNKKDVISKLNIVKEKLKI